MGHEDLAREQNVGKSSDRAFGGVFAAVFLLVACWPLLHGESIRWWSLTVSGAFAMIAVLRPALLVGLNRQWTKLGVILGKVVSPVALGIVFYGVVTPIGLIMRIAGKDPLRLRRDAAACSYWITRDPPGPPSDSMTNPF